MHIYPHLSKSVWNVLLHLVNMDQTPTEISLSLSIPLSRVSESIKQLSKANIIKSRKGYGTVKIDRPLKAALSSFLSDYSGNKLTSLFFGARLNVLMQVSKGYNTMSLLKSVIGSSDQTLKRIISIFQSSLLLCQSKRGVYVIRDDFKNKIKILESCFMSYFLDSLKMRDIEFSGYKTFGEIIIIKSVQSEVHGFFKTGFSVFSANHVPMFETNENYLVNLPQPPTKEEIFIHALVFSLVHQRDVILCMLFVKKNNLKLTKTMKESSMIYKVEKEATAIFNFIRSRGKVRDMDFLPVYTDYLEIEGDYDRK